MSWLDEYLEYEKRRQIPTISAIPPGLAGATPGMEEPIRGEPKMEGWYGGEPREIGGVTQSYGTRPSSKQILANQGLAPPDLLVSLVLPEPADIAGGFLAKPATTALNKLILAPLWPKAFSEVASKITNPVFHLEYPKSRSFSSRIVDILRGGDYSLQKHQDAIDNLVTTYPSLQDVARLDKKTWDWVQKVGNPGKLSEYYGLPSTWSNFFELNPDRTPIDLAWSFVRSGLNRVPGLKDVLEQEAVKKVIPKTKSYTAGDWSPFLSTARLMNPTESGLHEYGAHGLKLQNKGIAALSKYADAEVTPEIEKQLVDLGYDAAVHGNETIARLMDLGQGFGFDQQANKAILNELGESRIVQYIDAIKTALTNPDVTDKDIIRIMGPARPQANRGPLAENWAEYTKVANKPVAPPSFRGWQSVEPEAVPPPPKLSPEKAPGVKPTKEGKTVTPILTTVLPGPDDAAIIASRRKASVAPRKEELKQTSKFAGPAREWTSEARWVQVKDEGPFAKEIVKNQSLRHIRELKSFYKNNKSAIKGLLELESRIMTGPDNMIPAESNRVHAWLRRAAEEEAGKKVKGGKK